MIRKRYYVFGLSVIVVICLIIAKGTDNPAPKFFHELPQAEQEELLAQFQNPIEQKAILATMEPMGGNCHISVFNRRWRVDCQGNTEQCTSEQGSFQREFGLWALLSVREGCEEDVNHAWNTMDAIVSAAE